MPPKSPLPYPLSAEEKKQLQLAASSSGAPNVHATQSQDPSAFNMSGVDDALDAWRSTDDNRSNTPDLLKAGVNSFHSSAEVEGSSSKLKNDYHTGNIPPQLQAGGEKKPAEMPKSASSSASRPDGCKSK